MTDPLETLVRLVGERGSSIRRDAGAAIFRVGDRPRAVYAVVEGRVRIERPTEAGGRLVVEQKQPGDLLGEFGPLDGRPRSADAIAEEAVELATLSSDDFLALLHEVPEAAVALASTLARQLRDALERTSDRESVDTTTRVARRLVDLVDRFGEPVDDGRTVTLSQADLAGWVGATREATARSLGRLRDAGLVRTARRQVVVLDNDGLHDVARQGLSGSS